MHNFDDSKPIYLQVREKIESAIISGALEEDEILPSIRQLAKEYRLNPQTISNALSELVAENFLYKKRGIGFFVTPGAREKLIKKLLLEFKLNDLKQMIKKAKDLQISKEEIIALISEIY